MIIESVERILSQNNDQLPPNKILIFSEWTDVLDILEYFMEHKNIPCLRYDGAMTKDAKQETLQSFKEENSSAKILLISLLAGGVGLNLQCANYVMIVEPYWNQSMEDQALTRSYRIGQQRPVTVIHFIVDRLNGKESIEQYVRALQCKKDSHSKVFFENSLSGANPFPQLTLGYYASFHEEEEEEEESSTESEHATKKRRTCSMDNKRK